ncbi:hypothetical protein UNDYM_2126 [Undibacterium sp. YM2]|uniref:hypothetical protein n=1 Tax=Undibacterium sp. YM2 TaxID=2058625 RepID=UPI001331D303|nr:hypothetical protein [Undibacterium sp. YM2]BBB66379.1 hypothetical protein UNDYM_2126 [Undibacterium sp. YM2]
MTRKTAYWIGKRPSDGKAWQYAEHATIIDDASQAEMIYRMYRRYVKQWNDIELNPEKCLSAHTHEICGAAVISSSIHKFVLHAHNSSYQNHWILEVCLARGFSMYYPGGSCGLNTLRSIDDIRSIRLHWSQAGDEVFKAWLNTEKEINSANGESEEYRAKSSY